jgi:hypothetical protein
MAQQHPMQSVRRAASAGLPAAGPGGSWSGPVRIGAVALLGLLACLSLHGAGMHRLGPSPGGEHPLHIDADYLLRVRAKSGGRTTFEATASGPATMLVLGLTRGGAVTILVNGAPPASMELLARGGLALGRADSALVSAPVRAGLNEVLVSESDGVQMVRIPGTHQWFGASTSFAGSAMFSADLGEMFIPSREYCVSVYYGPQRSQFLSLSGRWDRYYGETYVDGMSRVQGGSGPNEATLSYTLEYSRRNLTMPTQLTLVPDPVSGAFTLRVRQVLRATGEPLLQPCMEYLHVKINDDGATDWGDGVTDYTWYRSQSGDNPDAAPGSHTGMVRVDDDTFRTYRYRVSNADAAKTALSDTHHTGGVWPLAASNTIGGFFTKTGVGSCGWVFEKYQASFRGDITPLYSHCGDGADTHFYLSWGEMLEPVGMRMGDKIEVEYSLTMLPSEVSREDIEDLNEADLHLFGKEKEQSSQITGWVGTKQAVGLRRCDGWLVLLGIGREPGRFPDPAARAANARVVYRVFDLPQPTHEALRISAGGVEVKPGWITVVDCGSARQRLPAEVAAAAAKLVGTAADALPDPAAVLAPALPPAPPSPAAPAPPTPVAPP